MGTELTARGVSTEGEGWSAYALETSPEVVRAIHAAHAAAGAVVHRTNTFRTQPRIFPDRWRSMVASAVALARSALGRPGLRLAGSIAPIHDCYRPDLSPRQGARAGHAALAEALAEAKVDLLVCETFPDPLEARVAVEEAVKTGLPTWAALTAGPDGDLMTPSVMAAAARDCISAGASAVLVCCTAATLTLPYVEALANGQVPFGAYANAGRPDDGMGGSDERAAARYGQLARSWREAGATIVGACCGTSPRHIAWLRNDL